MKKHSFEIGDIVKRVRGGTHCGMFVGDEDEIIAIKEDGNLILKSYEFSKDIKGSHDPSNFDLAVQKTEIYAIF